MRGARVGGTRRAGWKRAWPATAVFFLLVSLAAAAPVLGQDKEKDDGAELKTGRAVFRASCAGCHGYAGDGDAVGAAGFEFAPTNFTLGVFKFRSTRLESLPTDDDIRRSIRVGMPGTEMVPFAGLLTATSIDAVTAYVKSLSEEFADAGGGPDEDNIVEIPATRPFPPSPQSAEAGGEIFEREECVSCHGENGDGHGEDARGMTDDQDRPLRMLDWADGVFKSGHTDQDLFRTITTGMNGTPMESYLDSTTPQERWQLVDFIRSLDKSKEAGGFFDFLFSKSPSGLDYQP